MCVCFPNSATVETVDGKQPIGKLHQSKCPLLTLTPEFMENTKKDTFLTFLHFDPQRTSTFLAFSCQNGQRLLISPEHLLFVSTSGGIAVAMPAKAVEVGHSLICLNEDKGASLTPVVAIRTVEELGVFSPLSQSGTLLVDGFLVSCYAHVGNINQATAHASFAPLRLWYSSRNKWSKEFSSEPKIAKMRKNPPVGIHKYANGLMTLQRILPI